jgi:transcriptional regulator GlxA family with amidase domain
MPRTVGILIFDDVEVLDFAGPFEAFGVAGKRGETQKPFHVFTLAETAGPIIARNGLSLNPTYTLRYAPPLDILLIPGGYGTRREQHNANLIAWIQQQAPRVELLLSVCTGALILGRAGLLDGLNATTYWNALEELAEAAPTATLCPDERYVDNGRVLLSAGVSAGIDLSLYVVKRLLGAEVAADTARSMQYDYWTG